MSDPASNDAAQSKAFVIDWEESPTFWQPVPANGYVRNILNSTRTGGATSFSMSTQTVDPGCMIREHVHDHEEELFFMLEGEGFARLDGEEFPIKKGSTVYIGKGRRHHFINRGDKPFTFLVMMMPGGLDTFFERIGRPRHEGQPAPEPFARPADVNKIEQETVFGWVDKSFD